MITPGSLVLTEGSIYERLRRDESIAFDPQLAHASLVYDERAREKLANFHREYLAIGLDRGLPMIALADTWRASGERIARSRFAGRDVNGDNVRFLRELVAGSGGDVRVAALLGPRGDAYRASESPGYDDALRLHAPQVEALAAAAPDLIMAATLPSSIEARAMAMLLSQCGVPWILSFVVRQDGRLLDGTTFRDAMETIESRVSSEPLGFAINCVHPRVVRSAFEADPTLPERIVWFQANTSARSPEELDGLDHIEADEPEEYARELVSLQRDYGIPVLGGCCGAGSRHMIAVADAMVANRGAVRM